MDFPNPPRVGVQSSLRSLREIRNEGVRTFAGVHTTTT